MSYNRRFFIHLIFIVLNISGLLSVAFSDTLIVEIPLHIYDNKIYISAQVHGKYGFLLLNMEDKDSIFFNATNEIIGRADEYKSVSKINNGLTIDFYPVSIDKIFLGAAQLLVSDEWYVPADNGFMARNYHLANMNVIGILGFGVFQNLKLRVDISRSDRKLALYIADTQNETRNLFPFTVADVPVFSIMVGNIAYDAIISTTSFKSFVSADSALLNEPSLLVKKTGKVLIRRQDLFDPIFDTYLLLNPIRIRIGDLQFISPLLYSGPRKNSCVSGNRSVVLGSGILDGIKLSYDFSRQTISLIREDIGNQNESSHFFSEQTGIKLIYTTAMDALIVDEIRHNSIASEYGLRAGDFIYSINKKKIIEMIPGEAEYLINREPQLTLNILRRDFNKAIALEINLSKITNNQKE